VTTIGRYTTSLSTEVTVGTVIIAAAGTGSGRKFNAMTLCPACIVINRPVGSTDVHSSLIALRANARCHCIYAAAADTCLRISTFVISRAEVGGDTLAEKTVFGLLATIGAIQVAGFEFGTRRFTAAFAAEAQHIVRASPLQRAN